MPEWGWVIGDAFVAVIVVSIPVLAVVTRRRR